MSENPAGAPTAYDPHAERYVHGGRQWPNTDQGWSEYLDAIHDPDFWPSMRELDAWDARDAWNTARTAWTEARDGGDG